MNAKIRCLGLLLGVLVLITVWQTTPAQPATSAQNVQAAASEEKPSHRTAVVIAQWTRARDWTQEYIAKMPEANFGFKPVPEVRSFAKQMLHLA